METYLGYKLQAVLVKDTKNTKVESPPVDVRIISNKFK